MSFAAITASTQSVPTTTTQTIKADGIDVFYREAGHTHASTILLLHGFPTSSFQYRNLIPRLAERYRVIVSPFAVLAGFIVDWIK
jgi:pimeloyl-ACP methyl ester carboxylesterase